MKYLLLIVSVIAGFFIISFITEAVEFTTILSISNLSMNELRQNPSLYLELRNQTHILIFKLFYTTMAGIIGGYITAFISHYFIKTAAYSLIVLQLISLVWAAFFSSFSASLPMWMWICLIIIVPIGIFAGYRLSTPRLK